MTPDPAAPWIEDLERERARSELRTRFLSLVSHEFRTPLTVILSSAELLESFSDTMAPVRRQSHFRRIQTAVATMTVLLDNVSLLARFEGGQHEFHPESVPLETALAGLVEEVEPFRKPGQILTRSAHPADAFGAVDLRILRAVALNLLSNALRFSPENTCVEIGLSALATGTELCVSDRGPGILPGEELRIWEPFERGTNAAGTPGSGLGLAIVRRCMDLSGGTAELRPREGGGLEARILFPGIPVR